MRFVWRRASGRKDVPDGSKQAALAEARRAAATVRRDQGKADRRRAARQTDPAGSGPDAIGLD